MSLVASAITKSFPVMLIEPVMHKVAIYQVNYNTDNIKASTKPIEFVDSVYMYDFVLLGQQHR